ncbi:aldo/keto reductase [Rubrimonas cliftonensis]|uniref:Predicted oxidoreductase n=1 Tax=Rubrimonas cliftonensis TaxID=89524 RepID=A0A1H4E681_9RHOB|nr:aldo/keto reductase [Rubrimonas cliftonensis]SEA79882.1 Predicted oxidoreductase [Rubrimonas cliftonensis]
MSGLARRALFRGGPEVSRLCLGTMMFGDQADETATAAMLDRYLGAGGDFIDTADVYANGESERLLGRMLGPRRDGVILATKAGNAMRDVPGSGGLGARWIAEAADASLRRLGTDVIDLYYLHRDDETTPLEETVGALAKLIAAGKVRWWGFSNHRAWKIAEMVRVADALGAPRPVVAQPYHHALNRLVEIDYIPACAHFGVGVVPYSPLARGVLTGKYRTASPPEGSRAARADKRMMETEFRPETLAAAGRLADHAEATGRAPAALALQWVLANAAVSSVLIGPRNAAQLDGYLAAMEAPYGPEDEALVESLNPSGHAPAPGYADPQYPYRGRLYGAAQ